MIRDRSISTADGDMWVHENVPTGERAAAVVVLMEAFGVNHHIRNVCERFAAHGYVAVAPDLYHRSGRFLQGTYDDPASVMGHFSTLTTDGLAADVTATLEDLGREHGIGPARVGVIGFCLGGYAAVLAASRAEPGVVAGFYGAGLSIQRSGSPLDPLAPAFDRIRCPTHLFYGADDPVIPAEEVEATRSALAQHGVDATVTVYPSAGHGFFCDERPAYVAAAADDAWEHVTTAFASALRPSEPA